MITGVVRRIFDLRCPACGTLQPVVGLSSTYKRMGWGALNEYAVCISCTKRLKLVRRLPLGLHIGLSIMCAFLTAALFAFFGIMLMTWSMNTIGIWGQVVLPLFVIFWPILIGLTVYPLIRLCFRKVVIL